MNSLKNSKKIAIFGLVGTSIKLLTGPITLLIIAATLTKEELGFYYMFFSLIAMSQLLEVGVGSVLKSYYSYEVPVNRKYTIENKSNIFALYMFARKWYLLLSLLFFIIGIISGEATFQSYNDDILWKGPWYTLLFVACINLLLLPIKSYIEGMQYQLKLNFINIKSQVAMAISLWVALYFNFGLYSVALSQASGVVIFFICYYKDKDLKVEKTKTYDTFGTVFKKLLPLLKKTGIVWFLGYFYWNSFNFITFNMLGAQTAGVIGLSIALARAGMGVAGSIVISQLTVFSNLIANNKEKESFIIYKKYAFYSLLLLLFGYVIFIFGMLFKPDFYFFEKVLPIKQIMYLFTFFFIAHLVSLLDSYTRSYKVELFVFVQLFNSIFTPLMFFCSIYFDIEYFILPIVSAVLVLIFTYRKFNTLIHNKYDYR
jgi:O-antigen/teichoic acid export membrane protein